MARGISGETDTMYTSKTQTPDVDPAQGKLQDATDNDTVVAIPGRGCSSRPASTTELQTLHDESPPDTEKAIHCNVDGKYGKYAGDAPDGGFKAWSVLLAVSLTAFAANGYIGAWAIFQTYYEEILLSDSSPSDIAWIGSVQYALLFLPGLIVGRLFDLGYFKIPYFVASCGLVACNFIIAECTEYWQLFLVQGLVVGICGGMVFGPTVGIIFHWFSKRKALALGISAMSSSIGATVFPIAAQNLIPQVGFKWTMRIFGFMSLVVLGVGNLAIDRRLPPTNAKGGLFNWAAFKNPAYTVYCISGVTVFLGLYTALTYMPIHAIHGSVSDDFAFYLVAIVNSSSGCGRIIGGFLGDRFGALNIMTPFVALAGIMTFAWPFVRNERLLIAISVIYGFSCGAYVSIQLVPLRTMGGIEDVGRRTGMFMTLAAFGAVAGPPISGAINSATKGFEDVGWYAGATVLFSAALLIWTRFLHLGKFLGRC
ncbi:MFS general substrate transporter [Paxillus ammoniavirescens]|nr:MFS general substrate transporter [Paxillus ammoniavirescens]